MGDAEMRALERGCHSAWVDTFSFQAPGFYPRLGYEVFGELDYPPGHKRIFLQKRLAAAQRKLEQAKANGTPTKNLEDKIYEIEDAIRLSTQAS